MLNGRIYRAAFLPLLFALVIAGFSLTGRVAPLGSDLAPDAFEGARAFATLEGLAKRFPDRRPGSAGDQALAAYVASALRGLGAAGKGGFAVSTHRLRAQTIDGERTLTTVIAQRPGTTGEAPIAILAHRDAAGRGARAELSGTAALLELARVLAASETRHPIVLVSTSGGSGGDAGAADFAAHAGELAYSGGGAVIPGGSPGGARGAGGPLDAALVLGDLAGTRASGAAVSAFSAASGSAPALLQSTVAQAVAQQTGLAGGAPGAVAQLAHLVFPLAGGEQGPLDARGLPAVLVGAGGEQPPPAGEPVGPARLEAFGRGALASVYALDGVAAISGVPGGGVQTGLPIQHGKAIPAWSLRLLVAALLLPALLAIVDGLARLRRRSVPVGRWVVWTLACALPFLLCAAFVAVLGALGVISAPRPPVAAAALPFDRHALEAALASALALVLAWLGWPALMRRLGLPTRPQGDGAALGMLLVLGGLSLVTWAFDPLAALLLAFPLHLWLALALIAAAGTPADAPGYRVGRRRGRGRGLALVALGAAPLALLIAFNAGRMHLGLRGVAHTALLLLAGGRVGLAGALLWSVACGCLAAALLIALAAGGESASGPDGVQEWPPEHEPITIRGPFSYAGPGSLGGTESALRR